MGDNFARILHFQCQAYFKKFSKIINCQGLVTDTYCLQKGLYKALGWQKRVETCSVRCHIYKLPPPCRLNAPPLPDKKISDQILIQLSLNKLLKLLWGFLELICHYSWSFVELAAPNKRFSCILLHILELLSAFPATSFGKAFGKRYRTLLNIGDIWWNARTS